MRYLVVLKDYQDKSSMVLKTFNDKYNALFFIESYIADYIQLHDGDKDFYSNIIEEPSHMNSRRWSIYPYETIITRNINESLDQYKVFVKKVHRGVIYNGYKIKKVFSLNVVKALNNNYKLPKHNFQEEFDDDFDDFCMHYSNVLEELESSFNKSLGDSKSEDDKSCLED